MPARFNRVTHRGKNTMQKRFMLATTALLAFAVTAQAETLQDVQNKIHDIVSKYKSLQFKMKMTSDMNMGGASTKTDSTSEIETARKGDMVMSRVHTKMKTSSSMAGQEYKMDMESLSISDGKVMWTISESPQKTISKMKHDPNMNNYFSPKEGWKAMAEHYNIKLLPDETIDGKSCWVIEMEPKDATMKMAQSKTVSYYDKKTGISPKTITFGPDGKKSGEVVMSDVKIDADISADRFAYTPPAGAKVEDMTGGIGIPGIAGDKEAPKSAEKTNAGKD